MIGESAATAAAFGALLGGGIGLGLCLMLWAFPRWGAVSLDRRLLPYVRDVADPQGLTPLTAPPRPGSVPGILSALATRIGGADAVTRRLVRAGRAPDAARFRVRQLWCALAGLLVGAVVAVAAALAGSGVATAMLPLLGAAVGALAPELEVRRAVRTREQRIAEELPTVLEFLALCLAAGESTFDALRRVAAVGDGELIALLRAAVVEVGTGDALADALRGVAASAHVPALARSVDQIVAAIERGAPLAQVLQAQAGDAQEEAKRQLMERAGRKEIAMLFPLVFLILPLSVLIAIFPGVLMLRLGV
ncbi:MAG: type II secretion system F family protein [Microbacterium sp.]|uniref:type II secretion system F family protein n=1 Tax=Microbacterium sp. TaxID=51671 RepID=UPI0039E33660